MNLILILSLSSLLHAKDTACGKWDQKWYSCKTSDDCSIVADECGSKRIVVNKASVPDVEKYYTCRGRNAGCAANTEKPEALPIVKCEAYRVHFPEAKNVKSAEPVCIRLSDIVGMAIANSDVKRIESAIDEAKNVDMPLSHINETPLTLAALNAKTDVVEFLLKKKAKINFQTTNGYTALMFTAGNSYSDKKAAVETVKLLLKSGADKNLKNSRGETALNLAKLVKNSDLINLLK